MIELGENKGREESRDGRKRRGVGTHKIRARCGRDDSYNRASRVPSPGGFERDRALRVTKFNRVAKGPVP